MRKALVIGINYAGTDHELRGCLNDADDWATFLDGQRFSVGQLTEKNATRANVLAAVRALVDQTQPGETSAITYSGHGTWVPDLDGDEPDGRDEAICPYDMSADGKNLIIDDEFHLLFNRIKPGATVVFVTDSCHSGTVFRMLNPGGPAPGPRRVRFLPPSHFLKDMTLVHRMNRAFGQAAMRSDAPLPGLVHFSGCRDAEYCADAEFEGRASGAFTYYALRAFRGAVASSASYLDAWKGVRSFLPSWEYQQTPLLNATADLKAKPLLR